MDLIYGAGILTLAIILLVGGYLWRKSKPFRDRKKASEVRPDPHAGLPTKSRSRP